MKSRLLAHLAALGIAPGTPLLAAVSGGLDSVCMAHLLREAGFPLHVAHANFGLRGEASDGDAAFVADWASERGIPCHVRAFATQAHARSTGASIQMAARELRYAWFEELRLQEGCAFIATAHHLNDALETALFHLAKGGGIDGLAGIPPLAGKVVRPLLFASREEIRGYAAEAGILWREDASNQDDYYRRNFIRQHVVPALRAINPRLEHTAGRTLERLRQAQAVVRQAAEALRAQLRPLGGQGLLLPREACQGREGLPILLQALLSPFGFNYGQAKDLAAGLLGKTSGMRSSSGSHTAWVQAEGLAIFPSRPNLPKPRYVALDPALGEAVLEGIGVLRWETRPWAPRPFPDGKTEAWFDAGLWERPLVLRLWEDGDRIRPFGMRGSKTVGSLLNDLRVPLAAKASVPVLCAGEEVVWVVGHRSGWHGAIGPDTSKAVAFRWHPDAEGQK